MTGYRAEKKIVSTDENLKKSPHLFRPHCIFISPWKCTTLQSNANSLPITYYHFHVMLLLGNVMVSNEFASNRANLSSKPNGF